MRSASLRLRLRLRLAHAGLASDVQLKWAQPGTARFA
jgi:hypothetical protein